MAISTILARVVLLFAFAASAFAAPSEDDLFRKLKTLAESGSVAAQYNLGMLYNNGIGTRQDAKSAFKWFEKAAAAGDALASYKVGCYYAGQFAGVVIKDSEKALSAKLVAASAGYVLAQIDVGNMYALRRNFPEARIWWAAAAEQSAPQALLNLSEAYRLGEGVPKSMVKSLELTLVALRFVTPEQRNQLQPRLLELQREVGTMQVANAELAAAAYKPRISTLTARASLGVQEARELVQ